MFGQGSRTPVAITLLVKNPTKPAPGIIHYHDIGDYLTREEKLDTLARQRIDAVPWNRSRPTLRATGSTSATNISQTFSPLGDKRDSGSRPVFDAYSIGVVTARDAWAYSSRPRSLLPT